jgi:hypothetical protein
MEQMRNAYTILGGNPEEKYFRDLGLDRRIILKLFLNSERGRWAGLIISG